MDARVSARAKDPFFTTRPTGTGLGLAIVDRIVEAHGGDFVIESKPGIGTTATVFFPDARGRDAGGSMSERFASASTKHALDRGSEEGK